MKEKTRQRRKILLFAIFLFHCYFFFTSSSSFTLSLEFTEIFSCYFDVHCLKKDFVIKFKGAKLHRNNVI